MLKILQFNRYSILERPGGTYRYIDGLSQALARQGHQVYLFTTTRQGTNNLSVVERVPGYWIVQLRVSSSRGERLWEYFTKVPKRIYELDQMLEFDVLISHDPYLPVGVNLSKMHKASSLIWFFYISASYEAAYNAMRLRSLLSQPQRLWDRMAKAISIPLQQILEHHNLTRADRIIVLSEYACQMLARRHGERLLRKAVLIPGGVDTRCFYPANSRVARTRIGLPGDAVILFTVRNLSPRMGLENLIKAMRLVKQRLPDQDIRLYIAGRGLLSNVLQRMVEELRLEEMVYLLGYVSDEELPLYYQACDFFVLPSEALEGFGMVILEALATNKPVIGTPVGAIPETLSRFSPNLVAEGVGPEDLAAKIVECVIHKDTILSQWDSRSLVETEYDWDIIAQKVIGVLSQNV